MSLNKNVFISSIFFIVVMCVNTSVADTRDAQIKTAVDKIIMPLMAKEQIPGVAIAVAINGHEYFYNFGTIAKGNNRPITEQTLFKLGSLTKTFTALLTADLESEGKLNFYDYVSTYFPQLHHTEFEKTSLQNLATHTSGLPLFPPADIQNSTQFMNFVQQYKLTNSSGSRWSYSSTGMELLGLVDAKATGESYEDLLSEKILIPLQLTHTFFKVPDDQIDNFTQTYIDKINHKFPLVAADELISCSHDLIHYAESYLNNSAYPQVLQMSLIKVLIPQFKVSYYYQDFGWEQYDYTIDQKVMSNANMLLDDVPITKLNNSIIKNMRHTLINKTGSGGKTDSVYVGFIPEKQMAVVILANKQYSMAERSKVGLSLLKQLMIVTG